MIKTLLTLVLTLISLSSRAETTLKVGDVLLQPLDCWACDLIEAEEETIYSHIGIVISTDPVLVAEAKGTVRVRTLELFNSATEKGQQIKVLRLQNDLAVDALQKNQQAFQELYQSEFDSLAYDSAFRWNNLDENGNQKFYCSELVAKLLQAFLGLEPIVKKMHFRQNRESWMKFFQGDIPDGEWGNSPADYDNSHFFYEVGVL